MESEEQAGRSTGRADVERWHRPDDAPRSGPEIVPARDRLALVGDVWKPPGAGSRWQPGIPSLMRYVHPR